MTTVDRAANAAAHLMRKNVSFLESVRSACNSEGADFTLVCHELNRRANAHRAAKKRKAQEQEKPIISFQPRNLWYMEA
jgi:hypothetical protein